MKYVRRDFLKLSGASALASTSLLGCSPAEIRKAVPPREFDSTFSGHYLNRIAFPVGGIGAGMLCLEGTGAFSHFSLRNRPEIFNEPCTFSALSVRGLEHGARVLEGPVPDWKIFGLRGTGNGAAGTSYGFPRFDEATFAARFPFGTVELSDPGLPVSVGITGWSPFFPGDADNSSLPVAAFEYRFTNLSPNSIEITFSYNAKNFMRVGEKGNSIREFSNGFLLHQQGDQESPEKRGDFAAFLLDEPVTVNHCWFRGGWWDSLTLAWEAIQSGQIADRQPVEGPAPGASFSLSFDLEAGGERTIPLLFAWYVPLTDLRYGQDPDGAPELNECEPGSPCCVERKHHVPWYAGRFSGINEVAEYWAGNYHDLRNKSALFRDTFYDTNLPPEVIEAVAANLTILKSPTVRRQCDGRLWCFEGCSDDRGCCHGSCTHVWNYAQAIPHLFPELERSLRATEFGESQDSQGHQTFRAALPVRPVTHNFHSAADGQLGGIMKVHREWRISADTEWLREIWPKVKASLDYCISTWDPRRKGVLEEPHHNTYDIEFWGPDGMCTSFYIGALLAAIKMGDALGEVTDQYSELLNKGTRYLEDKLFDGDYYIQEIVWRGLNATDPVALSKESWTSDYSPEAIELLEKEGPKYQYGRGCLSDGVLGFWIAEMCGLGPALHEVIDREKLKKALQSIHRFNFKTDLSEHSNPQRPSYAVGQEPGLLLCTWPKGGELSLPFVYSNEVWTGIEYQVASHLLIEGMVEEGLEIVRGCRSRYDGIVRNPFNEYECGHWYARALASYGLLQGLTGVRFDAVDKVLFIDSRMGSDFRVFLSTESGFGTAGLRKGEPFVEVKSGAIDVRKFVVSGREVML